MLLFLMYFMKSYFKNLLRLLIQNCKKKLDTFFLVTDSDKLFVPASCDALTLYVAVTQFTYGKLRYCYVRKEVCVDK